MAPRSRSAFLAIPLVLLAAPLARAADPAGSGTAAKPIEVSAKGFTPPDLKGYTKLDWPQTGTTDASPKMEGKDTLVESFQNKAGDKVMKLSTNDVVWAFGVLPGGDPTKGYILRDPTCSKKLTEKWAPDAPFSAPDCAVSATPKKKPAPPAKK